MEVAEVPTWILSQVPTVAERALLDPYVQECKQRALYDTGIDAEYGDKLVTLSTCEYKKEEQNKRGNEYNKKAVLHLWKHKSGTASYFLHYSVVCFDNSFLQLPTSALSYTNRML